MILKIPQSYVKSLEDLRPYLDDGSDDVRWIQKRHVDPLSIPRMVKEPPLKRDISSKKSVSDLQIYTVLNLETTILNIPSVIMEH